MARLQAYSERDRRRDKRLYAILSNKDDSGGAADPTIKDQLDTGAIHAMTINTKKA